MARANDIRRLIAMAQQLRGPVVDHAQLVQNVLAKRTDPAVQLERKRRRLARKRAWAGRWATMWALITAICLVFVVAAVTGGLGGGELSTAIPAIVIGLISGTFAVRAGLRMRSLTMAQQALGAAEGLPPTAARFALPPKNSLARQPMEHLAQAESTLAELLTQITRGGCVPADSVEHTRRTGADAALVLRRVAAQLNAVERARDHAPPLERAPLADAVHRLRTQLDEGVDAYRSLLAAAGRVLAASSLGTPNQDLTNATDHLAGLASALSDLSPDG
jgi:hypothetical protein